MTIICLAPLFANFTKNKSTQKYIMKKKAFSEEHSVSKLEEKIQNNNQDIENFVKNCNINKFSALGATIQKEGDCSFLTMNASESFLNGVMYSCIKNSEIENIVEKITQYFANKNEPYCWWAEVSPESFLLKEALEKRGLNLIATFSGMILNVDNVIKPIISNDLEIEYINNKEELILWSQALSESYGCTKDFSKFYANLLAETGFGGSWYHIIGKKNNKVICTGSILCTDKGAYIYNISTSKNERNQGFGSNIMYELILLAKSKNINQIALFSPLNIVPFYLNLGFRELTYVDYYEYKF
ncbi:MAG: GNAT family N-acetyltransferase [Candidatus Thorarchaeota archaeon]